MQAENCIEKAATRIGHLKSQEIESRYKETENQIRLHNVESIGRGTDKHFRVMTNFINEKVKINQPIKIDIFKPRNNGQKFEPLALLTFNSANDKFSFEKAFANYKRATPSEQLCISRPAPTKSAGPSDIEETSSVRKRLGQLYNQAIIDEERRYNEPSP